MGGDEGIDKTEHLKLKQIENYVQQRPDRRSFEWNRERVFQTFPHPIDRLARTIEEGGLGIIDEHQLYSAIEIMLLHDVALKKLDIASMREFSHWFDWGEGPKHPETVYIRVMRALPRPHSHMIERLCFQKIVEQDYVWIEKQQHTVRAAFDNVGDLLAREKDRIRREAEDEIGKSFDDICRERFETYKAKCRIDKASIKKTLARTADSL